VSSEAPNPFVFGSPDGGRRGRRGAPDAWAGPSGPIERVAKADFSLARFIAIDLAITAYLAFIAWAMLAASSEQDAPPPAEAWAVLGFVVLTLAGLMVGFGHFVLQYVGLLGVLYARGVGQGWEFGPRWGFIFRHRIRLESGEGLTIVVHELAEKERGGRNYGKFRWTLTAAGREVRFRTPVGPTATVRRQITAWAEAHALSMTLEADPPA
jgi:hypothetical protein